MNMRIHLDKRLAELCFIILVLLCGSVEAYKDRKFIHQEIVVNQQRLMDKKAITDGMVDTVDIEKISAFLSEPEKAKEAEGLLIEKQQQQIAANDDDDDKEDENDVDIGSNKNETEPVEKKLTFWSGFVDSLSMIFFVEFGDRTFMITVLFTMKHDKWKVFVPAIFTMMGMHIISVGFGTLFPLLFSRNTIVYFSVFLFLFFGIMMIYEAYHLQPKTAEEKVQEIEDDLITKKDPEVNMTPGKEGALVEKKVMVEPENQLESEKVQEKESEKDKHFCTNPYLHLVVLLFLADWGDRCQISAIVLTATHNAWGVAAGGAIGMAICVFLAVIAGAFLANRLDEKKTTYIAGALFIVFAFQSLFMIE